MGCIDELDATFLAYKFVAMMDNTNDNFQLVFSQSSTVRVLFHKIHLQKLVEVISCHFQHVIISNALWTRNFSCSSHSQVQTTFSWPVFNWKNNEFVRDMEQVHNIMKELCVGFEKYTL